MHVLRMCGRRDNGNEDSDPDPELKEFRSIGVEECMYGSRQRFVGHQGVPQGNFSGAGCETVVAEPVDEVADDTAVVRTTQLVVPEAYRNVRLAA